MLSNMENINAILIEKGVVKLERLEELSRLSEKQLKSLNATDLIKSLKKETDTTYIDAEKKDK